MWTDRFIKAALLFLLFFTPLAFGSVHAWAYSLMEGIVALMVLAWAIKIWRRRNVEDDHKIRVWPYALPLGLFIGFVCLQLVPLPPGVLKVVSPSTYEVYTRALPGWPERAPYSDLLALVEEERSARVGEGETGRAGETGKGRDAGALNVDPTPYADSDPNPDSASNPALAPPGWLPLSISPSLTRADLLKLGTYSLLFFLILLYPAPGASRDPNHRMEYEIEFIRPFLYAIMIAAFLIATVGFLNLFTWNGRVLWFFVPHDANGGGGGVRAAAPFIAPPSFANYLAMTLPLIAVGMFSRTFLTPDRMGSGFRVLCGFAGFVMFCGILLTLSRAGWAAAVIGVGVLFLLMVLARGGRSWIARTPIRRVMTFGIAGFCLFLVVALVFVGPQGQESLDLRLQETATEATSLRGRFAVWQNSLDMARDFPVLGVGLGAWPDLFPRYQHPRLSGFYRETHNDYLELLTETGAIGFFLLFFFFVTCVSCILKHAFSLDPKTFPVVAALLAGMSAMAFHEIFDFSLQIPANAILFTIFLALSLRMTTAIGKEQQPTGLIPDTEPRTPSTEPRPSHLPVAVASLTLASLSILLLTSAFSQSMTPYPYYLRKQASLGDALAAVYAYPANAEAQIRLFDAAKRKKDTGWERFALETILWLAPGNTSVRDSYASRLLLEGRREEAWYEVTRSVAQAPSVNQHFYLSPKVASTLFPSEQQAIIYGFKKAIEDQHPGAMEGLAEFYHRTERFSDRANLYEEAAAAMKDSDEKADLLLKAADAAIRAKDLVRAEDFLLEATRLQPDDTALVTKLIAQIYMPRKDLDAAEKAVAEGIRNGADALTLRVSLAEAARSSGENEIAMSALTKALANGSNGSKLPRDRYGSYIRLARVAGSIGQDEVQEQALNKAIELQPNSYDALMEVGAMHEARRDYNRAAFYYRKATRANRGSAEPLKRLAQIEEQRFRFAEAGQAYKKAVRLDPKNKRLKDQYEAFKTKVARAREDGGPGTGDREAKTGDQRPETGGGR